MLEIEIDGKKTQVPYGSSIMDAAEQLKVYVPHFCYHKKLSVAANCRMCLVQVEKNAKPVPACATPVTDGMRVFTRSDVAIKAQKGVMEFLLINHPLDCPICDQGGECQLQDLSVGYGGIASRYEEEKRVVKNKNLVPLVSTDMTRCIHCTRCVRFGQEVAGIMEMGMIGRGEHAEIMPYIESTIDSELSGNIIDLCPVGALTSKPFRYTARSWELSRRKSISPHDGLGSNLIVHVKNGRVMRVVPQSNESINECWIADRDRFSYEALNSEDRLKKPMIRRNGKLEECSWQEALEVVATTLKSISADQLGFLASPHQTLEELFLVQKLSRGLGSANVDSQLSRLDYQSDAALKGIPHLGMPIEKVQFLDRCLIIGSILRKEQPVFAHRIREAVKYGAHLNVINPVSHVFNARIANHIVVKPSQMVSSLAQVLKAALSLKSAQLSDTTLSVLLERENVVSATAEAIANSLISGNDTAIFLGQIAQNNPNYSILYALANELSQVCGTKLGVFSPAANTVGTYIAGTLPFAGQLKQSVKVGLSAHEMFAKKLKAYVLVGVEPELDSYNGAEAFKAMKEAEFVVALSAFKTGASEYANVLLPIAPFTETSGSFVNMEGRVQSFNAAVKPLDETRPAWKVLRVLGNLLELSGFDQNSSEDVKKALLGQKPQETIDALLNNVLAVGQLKIDAQVLSKNSGFERVGDIPLYQSDMLVRRAPSLQQTKDAMGPVALINSQSVPNLKENQSVTLTQKNGEKLSVKVAFDQTLPKDVIRIIGAHPVSAKLGGLFDEIQLTA